MLKIGLTGNRYSGKDTVAKLFKQMLVPVFEADVVVKFIVSQNEEVKEKMRLRFGDRAYDEREIFVGGIIKTDADFNHFVESVEFELRRAYDNFRIANKQSIYTVFKSSILFESGWNVFMDKNICVFCPKKERMARANRTTGLSISKLKKLLSGEMDDTTKNGLADYVVHNYETNFFADTITEINNIDCHIVDEAVSKKQKEVSI